MIKRCRWAWDDEEGACARPVSSEFGCLCPVHAAQFADLLKQDENWDHTLPGFLLPDKQIYRWGRTAMGMTKTHSEPFDPLRAKSRVH